MSEAAHQFPVAERFHSTPRFGHSSNFAQFFSDHRDDQVDYIQGIFAFGIFMICLLVIWLLVLLILKVFLGSEQVGCAAGGGIINVNEIKKKKPELKGKIQDIVVRSWRIQGVFFLCGILIPAATGLFLKQGLTTMVHAIEEISSINNDVESVATRGMLIVDTLMREHDNIHKIQADDVLNIERHCPQRMNITLNISISDSGSQVLASMETLDALVDEELVYARRGLEAMFSTTRQLDGWVKWILKNDWVPKLFLTALNVVSLALLCGVLLSRNNIVHFPYKCMLVWFLVPLFIALLVVATVGTSSIGMAVSLNADFCSGGDSSSPEGTIEEIILSKDVTVEDLSYQSFVYYMDSCTTMNPMEYVAAFQPQIRGTVSQAKDFLKLVGEYGLETVTAECGADVSPLVDGAQRLIESLETVVANIDSAFVLADCSTISHILRRIFHGASCNEAVDGLGWMFGSMLALTMLGLVMVTLRAALYNATIRACRIKRPDETHREFREYQRYMSQFYEDATMWKFEPDKGPDGLAAPASFDTGATSESSMEEGNESPGKFVEISLNDGFYSDDSSSYESDLSDGSLDEERYKTPSKQASLVEQIKTAEKVRDLMYVLDDELRPLSPPEAFHPKAPQKYLKSLQRTTQRKVLM